MSELIRQRADFADCLDRLASGSASHRDWDTYLVAHYADEFLEEMRRCVVRLRHHSDAVWGSDDSRATLRHWATAVRLATQVNVEGDAASNVDIRITIPECIVLDAILRRYLETHTLTVNDPAEQRTLSGVQCVLEKLTARNDWPDIESARRTLGAD